MIPLNPDLYTAEVVIPLRPARNNLERKSILYPQQVTVGNRRIICGKENCFLCILFICNCFLIGVLTYFMMSYQFSVPEPESLPELSVSNPKQNWICNSSMKIRDYVKPKLVTTVHEPRSACVPLALSNMDAVRSTSSRSCKEPIFVLIAVISATENFVVRDTIRRTWGNVSYFENDKNHSVRVIFSLGMSNKVHTQDEISQESKNYGDILQEAFVDSYFNLSIKSIMTFKWIQRYSESVRFVLKAHDDVEINIYNLLDHLKSIEHLSPSEDVFLGNLHTPNITLREESWDVPTCLMEQHISYPAFLNGAGYIMSISTVEKLYHSSFETPLFPIESIFIGMCARNADIKPEDYPYCMITGRVPPICTALKYIMAHTYPLKKSKFYLSPDETIKRRRICNYREPPKYNGSAFIEVMNLNSSST